TSGALEGLCPVCMVQVMQEVPTIISVTEKPGDRIGRYKLLQKIGEGRRRVRSRTPGAGPDGSSEHRAGVRRGRDRYGPALLRDGTGARHQDHRVLRSEPTFHHAEAPPATSTFASASHTVPTRM